MGHDRGGFAPTTSRCRSVVAPPARAFRSVGANVVQREATEGPGRAPYHRRPGCGPTLAPETSGPAAAAGELLASETVRLKAVGSVYLNELPYLVATCEGGGVDLSDQRFLVWLGDGPGLEVNGFSRPEKRR
jgi:hypothetical protein